MSRTMMVREVDTLVITYKHPPYDGSYGCLPMWQLHWVSGKAMVQEVIMLVTTYVLGVVIKDPRRPLGLISPASQRLGLSKPPPSKAPAFQSPTSQRLSPRKARSPETSAFRSPGLLEPCLSKAQPPEGSVSEALAS